MLEKKYYFPLLLKSFIIFFQKLFLTYTFFLGPQSDTLHKLNYQELEKAANRLGRSILKIIHDLNGQPNSDGDWVIAVSLTPSDALILTLLAIWKTGAAYLPIDKCAPSSRVQHIISEARPVLIITEDKDSKFMLRMIQKL